MGGALKLEIENWDGFAPRMAEIVPLFKKTGVFRRHHVLNDPINFVDSDGTSRSAITSIITGAAAIAGLLYKAGKIAVDLWEIHNLNQISNATPPPPSSQDLQGILERNQLQAQISCKQADYLSDIGLNFPGTTANPNFPTPVPKGPYLK